MMRVIHTIASTRVDHGGTSRSVPATCEALAKAGADVHLVTSLPADPAIPCNLPDDRERVHTFRQPRHWPSWGLGAGFRKVLASLALPHQALIIHDHGLWLASNHAVADFSHRHRILRVVSPRGMAGPWAMARGRWKKRLAWWWYQHRDLACVDGFHATSEEEARELRELGFRQPIAVIPNGVDVPESLPPRRTLPGRRALFLSRIHPKKGLLLLVQAWHAATIPSDWELILAGPDEGGHLVEVLAECRRLGIDRRVTYIGPVSDQEKWQYLVDADLLVLPSYSENFGIVIAEALAAGVPALVSRATPWEILERDRLGWWVDPTVPAVAAALTSACGLSVEERADMGKRGALMVRAELRWGKVAGQLLAFYESLLAGRRGEV